MCPRKIVKILQLLLNDMNDPLILLPATVVLGMNCAFCITRVPTMVTYLSTVEYWIIYLQLRTTAPRRMGNDLYKYTSASGKTLSKSNQFHLSS